MDDARWFLADTRTGRIIADIQPLSGSLDRKLNSPETITATVDMWDPDTVALNLAVTAKEGRVCLGVAVDGVILGCGPIWGQSYDRPKGTLKLTARGLWSYFDHRYVLPIAAATLPVTQFTIPDGGSEGKTKPNPTVGTYLVGFEYGTIAKRWVQQCQTWTGGNVPVVFEDDRTGSRERNMDGAQFKNVGTVMKQLTEVENGPDLVFLARYTGDGLGVEWFLKTGTDTDPLIHSTSVHLWDMSVPESPISDFQVDRDASELAGTAWFTGGRSTDTVLVARSIDTTLTDAGFPLFEQLDSSHSSVEIQSTLDDYAKEATRFGRSSWDEWSFTVEANSIPRLTEYWEGDFCDITIAPYGAREFEVPIELDADGLIDPADIGIPAFTDVEGLLGTGGLTVEQVDQLLEARATERLPFTGDPYLYEGGTFRHRIIGFSVDHTFRTVKIMTASERL